MQVRMGEIDNVDTPPQGIIIYIAVQRVVGDQPDFILGLVAEHIPVLKCRLYPVPTGELFYFSGVKRLVSIALTRYHYTSWLNRSQIKVLIVAITLGSERVEIHLLGKRVKQEGKQYLSKCPFTAARRAIQV